MENGDRGRLRYLRLGEACKWEMPSRLDLLWVWDGKHRSDDVDKANALCRLCRAEYTVGTRHSVGRPRNRIEDQQEPFPL